MRPATVGLATIGAAFAASLLIGPAHAQQASSPLVGEPVRVTGFGGLGPLTGRVLRLDRDTLVLQQGSGATRAIELVEIERLEHSLGLHGRAGRGAWVGTLIGAGAGALLGVAIFAGDRGVDVFDQVSAAEGAGFLAVTGLGAGALVGVTVGALTKSERWTDVPRQQWSLSVDAQEGVRVGLRFAI